VTETRPRAQLTLLVRAYCHLCDDMRQALSPLVGARIAIEEIDVDTDPTLEARWGDKVPVLLAGDRELSRYRLDNAALAAYLARHSR